MRRSQESLRVPAWRTTAEIEREEEGEGREFRCGQAMVRVPAGQPGRDAPDLEPGSGSPTEACWAWGRLSFLCLHGGQLPLGHRSLCLSKEAKGI